MPRAVSTTVCSHCLDEFPNKDLYWVDREMHRGHPKFGCYRTPYCEECIKDTDSYVKIFQEPKSKKKK